MMLKVLALALSVTALASSLTKRLSENKPWEMSNVTVYFAKDLPLGASYIDFTFKDINEGLQLVTRCSRFALPGDDPIDSGTKYPCTNRTVGFGFHGNLFQLQRTYLDTSVGPAGMDYVTAFGEANATFTKPDDEPLCGDVERQQYLEVPITALVAK